MRRFILKQCNIETRYFLWWPNWSLSISSPDVSWVSFVSMQICRRCCHVMCGDYNVEFSPPGAKATNLLWLPKFKFNLLKNKIACNWDGTTPGLDSHVLWCYAVLQKNIFLLPNFTLDNVGRENLKETTLKKWD